MTVLSNSCWPQDAFLAISLHGSGVELGSVSAAAVCRYAEALRLGLQGAIEIIEMAKPVAASGRRKRWIEKMTDLPLLGIEHGELRILLGEPKQASLFADSNRKSLAAAVDLLFQGIAYFAAEESGRDTKLVTVISQETLPKLLGIVSRLTPPRRGRIERVTIWRQANKFTANLSKVISLDRASRDRIATEINKQINSPPELNADSHIGLTKNNRDFELFTRSEGD